MGKGDAIHPYRHEELWVFDEGQRSKSRDQGSEVSCQRRHPEARRAVRRDKESCYFELRMANFGLGGAAMEQR